MNPDQWKEARHLLRRLTPEGYQSIRDDLRRITTPKDRVPHPFYPFEDQSPISDGWLREVEREGAPCDEQIDIGSLELVPLLGDGERWCLGDEMLRRSADSGAFLGCQGWSQHHAEQLLARASELPTEWGGNGRSVLILFADTILVNKWGNRCVPYLFKGNTGWRLSWLAIGHGFFPRARLIRFRHFPT